MDFNDDELRLILDALSCLSNERKLDVEDSQTLETVREKIRQHFIHPFDK